MSSEHVLRRRRPEPEPTKEPVKDATAKDDSSVVWGKTPAGQVFVVPVTHDVLTLFNPKYPKSHFDILNLALLGSQILLFFYLPRTYAQIFFLFYFAFWRAAYDAGLGHVLTKQSKKKWIVRQIQSRGWLDPKRRPDMREWIRKQLVGKMGSDYDFDELPTEYNTWLLFRQAVDVILLNDFVAYCMFAFACFRIPEDLSLFVHVMRWITGLLLIAFNLWVKTEAHDVVKDYGWYWGDCFFQRGNLVFDGVFELAPHPMYSVGYAGYYGLSLIVGSYKVLFISLAAHAAQFGFLVFFENPHIERNYIQRKAIAKRTPIHLPSQSQDAASDSESTAASEPENDPEPEPVQLPTPSVTETDTLTETEVDTEVDGEGNPVITTEKKKRKTKVKIPKSSKKKIKPLSEHDLFNKYFRRDTLVLKNLDPFRATDFLFLLLLTYTVLPSLLSSISSSQSIISSPGIHFTHTLLWTLFHCFGLGLVLKSQSEDRWLVKRFLRNYSYEEEGVEGAKKEAWASWKVVYNASLVMMNLSFLTLIYHTYSPPSPYLFLSPSFYQGNALLRHTLGSLLIALHIWASLESYEVLGVFGWFFGDFFLDIPGRGLEYGGVYRYLNNPEMTGGAAWFGFSLIVWGSGSSSAAPKLVLTLAIIRHLAHWWFLRYVENPHMRKLYGDSVRKGEDAGFVKVLRSKLGEGVKKWEEKEEVKRLIRALEKEGKEVRGTVGKVVEETKDVVEEFLRRSRPKLTEVVQDTKVLLMQSRERLVITRISSPNDLSFYDASKYKMAIAPSTSSPASTSRPSSPSSSTMKFPLGHPLTIHWRAPAHHSRKDWIGIYRVGANKSNDKTGVSSRGMWVPVVEEDWDGDIWVGPEQREGDKATEEEGKEREEVGAGTEGTVVFRGDRLPWVAGTYEVRYHHDGKYNVMCVGGPFEIVVEKPDPASLTFDSIRSTLLRTIPRCLDDDPALIPRAAKNDGSGTSDSEEEYQDSDHRDADDFSFWNPKQAKRICGAIKQMFGVEYAVEVILADANVGRLAGRILAERRM
ncbi:phosphatidylethanolamine N-methyltransferase [Marasmius crinis-equi]|uniref:Phosphatidylethanolamine N-methyltransferase n=1 Tax=Marasmius crinis-equi TaxID=585013 RepID=A0ABR3FEW9_9AGAR